MGIQNRSLQIDDEVWEGLAGNPLSANQLLRLQLGLDKSAEPRKQRLSRLERMKAELRASDPLAEILGREDIEHGNMDLPTSGSISIQVPVVRATLDVISPPAGSNIGKASVEQYTKKRAGTGRIMRQKGDKTR